MDAWMIDQPLSGFNGAKSKARSVVSGMFELDGIHIANIRNRVGARNVFFSN